MSYKFNQKVKQAGMLDNRSQKVTNQAGGAGYTHKSLMALYSILTTEKFQKDTYYMKLDAKYTMLTKAIDECVRVWGAEFTAKVIVYSRSKDGHRTSSHLAATYMARYLSGKDFAKFFFSKFDRKQNRGGIVYRMDDAMEIAAAYLCLKAQEKGRKVTGTGSFKGISLPNSMIKGLRLALEGADWYSLAKYQKQGALVSLVDLINIVRPNRLHANPSSWRWIPFTEYKENMEKNITTRNKEAVEARIAKVQTTIDSETGKIKVQAFEAAVNGWLRQENTSEDRNSKSGQEIAKQVKEGKISKEEAVVKKAQAKQANYKDLIGTGKLGYLALIRQLRQIHDVCVSGQDKELVTETCKMIINESLIKKSLIWPYQLEQAYEIMMYELGTNISREFGKHIVRAYDSACTNLEELGFFGRSSVVVDTSGSMGGKSGIFGKHYSWGNSVEAPKGKFGHERSCLDIAGLIGGTIAKGVNGDLYQFSTTTKAIEYSPANTAFGINETIQGRRGEVGAGTNMNTIFNTIKPCERVFIISDMQTSHYLTSAYQAYKNWMERHGLSGVYVYLINVNSYGTTAMPDSTDPHIINCAGYSFEMLKTMIEQETDPNALAKEIESVNLTPVKQRETADPFTAKVVQMDPPKAV